MIIGETEADFYWVGPDPDQNGLYLSGILTSSVRQILVMAYYPIDFSFVRWTGILFSFTRQGVHKNLRLSPLLYSNQNISLTTFTIPSDVRSPAPVRRRYSVARALRSCVRARWITRACSRRRRDALRPRTPSRRALTRNHAPPWRPDR